jgi:hypothetical protein
MKDVSPELIDFLRSGQEFFMADLYTFKLLDGTILRLTSFDNSVQVGPLLYSATGPAIERSRIKQRVGVQVDNLELEIFPRAADLLRSLPWPGSLTAGNLDGARITLERAFFPSPLKTIQGPEIIVNGDFEGADLSDFWFFKEDSADGSMALQTGGAFAGSKCVKISVVNGGPDLLGVAFGSNYYPPDNRAKNGTTWRAVFAAKASKPATLWLAWSGDIKGDDYVNLPYQLTPRYKVFSSTFILPRDEQNFGPYFNLGGQANNGVDFYLDILSFYEEVPFAGVAPVVPLGIVKLFEGRAADMEISRTKITLSIKSDLELLNIQMPRNVYQAGCIYTLYEPDCGAPASTFRVEGVVTGTSSTRREIHASGLSQPAPWFDLGHLTFTSGLNNGASRTIKTYSPGVLHLALNLPATPGPGDTFHVWPGCDKTLDTCQGKFNNRAHFRGFPFIPEPRTIY